MTKFTDAAVDRVAKAMHAASDGCSIGGWERWRSAARVHLAAACEIAFMPMCEVVEPEPPKVAPDEELGRKILGEAVMSTLDGVRGEMYVSVHTSEFAKIGAAARKLLQP